MTNLIRILKTTLKHISRNTWMSVASVAVMTLTFSVLTIFFLLGYTSNLVLQRVEQEPQVIPFFDTGTPEEEIFKVKSRIEATGKVDFVQYVSEEEALEEFRRDYADDPLMLESISENVLPASLRIRTKKLDYLEDIYRILEDEKNTNAYITDIGYQRDVTNILKEIILWIRVGGAVLLLFMLIVSLLLILITVGITIKGHVEEIEIMQLVGGGNWYIKLPYIFEGAFYGGLGAAIATAVIYSAGILIRIVGDESPTLDFVTNFLSDLNWPENLLMVLITVFTGEIAIGMIIGAISSFVAVWRYME